MSGQWEHTPEQRMAASTMRCYSFGFHLAIAQASLGPHAHIFQIGLHLTQPRSTRAAPRHGPTPRIRALYDTIAENLLQGVAPHARRGTVGAHELCR